VITVKELAERLSLPINKLILELMKNGILATQNENIDHDTGVLLAQELGFTVADDLRRAIATGDTGYLTKVSGIGRKTAEKIVLELRDKLAAHAGSDGKHSLRAESDTVLALQALGYSQIEARDALRHVPSEITDTNARIKEALKILGQK
jgi:Holliday junction DNA helicase RuvA